MKFLILYYTLEDQWFAPTLSPTYTLHHFYLSHQYLLYFVGYLHPAMNQPAKQPAPANIDTALLRCGGVIPAKLTIHPNTEPDRFNKQGGWVGYAGCLRKMRK